MQQTISYYRIRQFIGILGMALPFACMLIVWVIDRSDVLNNTRFAYMDAIEVVSNDPFRVATKPFETDGILKQSVSHYYYSAAGPLFTGTIISLAIFLFCYRGHSRKPGDKFGWITDNGLANLAAWLALGIVIFPTGAVEPLDDNLYIFRATALTGIVHLVCASGFFALMAVFSMVNFRRNGSGGWASGPANRWFLFAGCGMLMALASAGIYIPLRNVGTLPDIPYVFWAEVVMLFLFGSAWLVKSKSILTEMIFRTSDTIKVAGSEPTAAV